ncbi:hypothetical protein LQW54_000597 [Pestalotiopsis sp. IQ-011]
MDRGEQVVQTVAADSDIESVEDATNKIDQPIRFKVEYRHPETYEVISSQTTTRLGEENGDLDQDQHDPVFEVVTTYEARITKGSTKETYDSIPPRKSFKAPKYRLRIYSLALRNALRTVVKYYPSQDLSGDVIEVHWPYPVLAHHYSELDEYKNACATKEKEDLCVRDVDAFDHITLLLDFLDENIMKEVRIEQERNARGFYTWEYAWVPYQPGVFSTVRQAEDREHRTYVIKSVSGGTFTDPRIEWTITYWTLAFDGEYVIREQSRSFDDPFDGDSSLDDILSLRENQIREDTIGGLSEPVRERYDYGERYWNLLQKQCRFYKGKTESFPFNEVQGLVMTDPVTYFTDFPSEIPTAMDGDDLRDATSDCSCSVCKSRKENTPAKVETQFESYFHQTLPTESEKLLPQQYLLFPHVIRAFVFATRSWELLHVKNFEEPQFQEGMIENLVMNQRRKDTLKALASSFARIDRKGENLAKDMWSADFIKGKGSGMIFLLHGQPGVGKTYTAECIAAYAKRPLMTLTASDIGTNPSYIEYNLTRHFRTAKSWGAILLIDEADVFMERRTSSDLVRNSLVAGFLRALEYYEGILFLTTNRVGAFDDAFISRIHIQLYYESFGEDERRKVWQTFVNKLSDERGNYIRLNAAAKEYIYSKEVCSMKWNGREIRNAFQTAVALSEFEGKKDEEGTILMTDDHFRPVMELSHDFKGYLNELHKRDEEKRAEVHLERLDSYRTT